MKHFKRAAAMLLAVVLSLCLAVTAFAADTEQKTGSTMTRSCRWRISTLDTPPLTSSNCAPQRKNTAPREMNSCQVVRTW